MPYTHADHLHRFACWTAARAAQRGWAGGTTSVIAEALEEANFQEEIKNFAQSNPDEAAFDKWHSTQVQNIGNELLGLKLSPAGITYGRIAKIIAIYIKTVCVSANPTSSLAQVAHPPIDSILLKKVKCCQKVKEKGIPYPVGLGFHWSKFCKLRYLEAVKYLRKVNGDKAFWEIEVYWKAAAPKPKQA